MAWWQIGAIVLGSIAVLLALGYAYEALRSRWLARNDRPVALGESFTLPPGRVAVLGLLRVRREGDQVIATHFDEWRFRLGALPGLIHDWQIASVGSGEEGPLFRIDSWRGIDLRVERADFSYAEAIAADWPASGEQPHQPFPRVPIAGTFVFDPRVLREAGAPTWAVSRHIVVFIVEAATGRAWPGHSLLEIQRGELFARTGLHPSWALEPHLAPDGELPELERGSITAELGPYLVKPTAPMELKIVAALGPYRSNEVRVLIRP